MQTLKKSTAKLVIAHQARDVDNKIRVFRPQPTHTVKTSLKLYTTTGYVFIKYEHIIYCRAFGNYAEVFFIESNELNSHIISRTLKSLQAELPNHRFARCHQSYLVQLNQIKLLTRDQTIVLHAGIELPVSRRMKKEILGRI